MSYRLPPQPGEWIDRNRSLRFMFEGSDYTGFAGDTISSALAASGVRLLGRSFKYHRPRGIYSMANHDVNALFEDHARTNIRGDVVPLIDGDHFQAVNTFGNLKHDWARFVDWFGAFLPVGFYYKTFHNPKRLFPFYEQRMREMAGLGSINAKHVHTRTPKAYAFCDVLVLGAGPAGLAAAVAAAECGAEVVVVDENRRVGGSLNYQPLDEAGKAAGEQLLAQAAALANVRILTSTVAAGCYADHWVALVDDTRLTKMRAASVVMACGACEQPAVFGNNDLPGVMLATAAQRLIRQYAVKPFDAGVLLAANAEGYRAALDLKRAGVDVRAIIDLRPGGEPSDAAQKVGVEGIPIHVGHAIHKAIPRSGKLGIRGVIVCPLDQRGQPDESKGFRIAGDGIAMSVGWAPADGLFYQAGGRMTWSDQLHQFVPKSAPPGVFAAGRLNGIYALADRVADGGRAGLAAAAYLGRYSGRLASEPARPAQAPSHFYPVFPHPHAKNFIDFDEDVQYKDFVNAAQEGFDQVELMKRYSTFGMGPSQGKLANINAVRILAKIKGQTIPETGVTTSRPFYHPVALSHLAGRSFHPHRHTPLHSRHRAAGAVFMPAGEWQRPAYYAVAGKAASECIAEEVTAVRQRLGVIDVGTLGKLEISGPDSAEFIERIYTGRFAKMAIGTTRYGLMCDETGVIIDDGIVARLAEDRFYVTTTTTASGGVYREMQRWAIIWGLKVVLANATGHYGAINVAGPESRKLLRPMTGLDLSEAAFPYLGAREGAILGVPARFIRVGFVGELGYEIHVPATHVRAIWDAAFAAGQAQGIRPFGVEAQRVLRLEKGHVIVSQDTDGLTNPFEAHMAWALKLDKPFFIGQRSLQILRNRPRTRQLVGFTLPRGYSGPLPKECHLIIEANQFAGRVTSVTYSPTLSQMIGLAFVAPDKVTPGTGFRIRVDSGDLVPATVAALPFYDPENLRQTRSGD